MRSKVRAAIPLFAAALADLPVVYRLVGDDVAPPAVSLSLGLLAMGLAWSGGCALEGRRAGTVYAIAWLGVAQPLALASPLARAHVDAAWTWLVLSALFALAGLVAFHRRDATPTGGAS